MRAKRKKHRKQACISVVCLKALKDLRFQEAKVMATCLYTANAIKAIHMKYQSFTFIIGCP